VSITARDRKILMGIVVLALFGAYWFLVLSPKREETSAVDTELTEAQGRRDQAVAQAAKLDRDRQNFTVDYATVVRLGKAVPATIDLPSLIVQLDQAAADAEIDFDRIKTGDRATGAAATPPPAAGAAPPPGGAAPPPGAAAPPPGGAAPPAASAPGQTRDAAQGATNNANQSAAAQPGATPPPAGGAAPAPATGAGAEPSSIPGLDTVPLEFTFEGSFFEMADLFHRLKRFVHLKGEKIVVQGRLMSIDGFTLAPGASPRQLSAQIKATVYLAPKAEGPSAGATPTGPDPAAAPGAPQPASAPAPTTATATP